MALTILNGPSASGKTTLMEMILNGAFGRAPLPIKKLLTVTTRPPRVGEQHLIHYRFMTESEYHEADQRGDMIEKTEYAGVKYGVLRQDLEPLLEPGNDAIVVMDAFGFMKMTEFLGRDNVDLIFVYADINLLEQRMKERGEKPEVIARRLKQAVDREFVGKAFASLVINTNHDLETCYNQLYHHMLRQSLKRSLRGVHHGEVKID